LDWEKSGDQARSDAVAGAGQALAAGFPVFVIGVLDPDPSDSVIETLNDMATAGGKPRTSGDQLFYLASTEGELTQALTEITSQVASCVFSFGSPPPDPTNIAVKLDGTRLAQDPTHTNGWDYTSDEHLGVELFGAACDTVKASRQTEVNVIFGCPGVTIR